MRVYKLAVGPFEMNAYIVAEDEGKNCVLIDPGDEPGRIIEAIKNHQLEPERILLTHAHIDHIRYLKTIQDKLGLPLFMHEDDLPLLENINEQALFFDLTSSGVPHVDGFVRDNQEIEIGSMHLKVLHTPGHSPGGVCYYGDHHLFAGDVLFKESIGRTDLYGGNFNLLKESIKNKLLTLPDETVVHPGHGEDTTIGQEKRRNPFLTKIDELE
jgi:glyoxylase-like metal-dependent hydrolase (beta-lactamase superfamily II)